MAAKKKQSKPCDCVGKANEALLKQNLRLDTVYNFTKGRVYPRIGLEVVDKDVRPKTKIPVMLPTFCPLCGKKYPAD